jgi:hypothetical protein
MQGVHGIIMIGIYSYLSDKERIRLGEVNKTFYKDHEYRGSCEGVYGDDNRSISKALEVVEYFFLQDGTPSSIFGFRSPAWYDSLELRLRLTRCRRGG